jgi:SNF2 family DNA or RNA helicase
MKTQPMDHQSRGLDWSDGKRYYGLFWEQGTGKTWELLADTERAFGRGKINGLLVVAPKGVHTNWTRREIPTHLSAPFKTAAYRSGSAPALRACQALNVDKSDKLHVLSINVDALNFKEGFSVAAQFLREHRAIMAVDESQRIKTPTTGVTKAALRLGRLAVARRIASGTPMTNAPMDLYSQMEFLKPGLLGTDSYRAFVARHAELMPDDAGIMRHIVKRMKEKHAWARKAAERGELKTPQIIRQHNGRPIWKNLDELTRLLAPHTMRVLKKDCLDLPKKIYQTRYFNLTAAQQRAYNQLKEELILEVGEDFLAVSALAARTKLQQLTSGFVLIEGNPVYVEKLATPRLELLKEVVLDQQGQFIIWAHFREEIAAIMRMLSEMGVSACEYHGGIKDKARDEAVDGFMNGEFQAFVGQPQSGGVGLTLTAASSVIYYSNDFNWGTRAQSEDRAHRRGSKEGVIHRVGEVDIEGILYIDLCAEDTIDETISSALRFKEETAMQVLGDA